MENFDNFVVMKKGFLENLNISIDEIIEEKEDLKLDYDLIEKLLGEMVKRNKNINDTSITIITPVKKEKILKITLAFFKSIDMELYKKTIDTILQQNKNIKMSIYNFHKIKDFIKKDENELLEYTTNGSVQTINGFARISIPTRTDLDLIEERIINKNKCLLEDLFTVVHEISHLFDLDIEKGKLSKKELKGEVGDQETGTTREILGEATTYAFETMLSEYLKENKLYSEDAINSIDIQRINGSLQHAKLVYAKLVLAKEKEKTGEITLSYIEKMMRDNNLSIQYVRNMAGRIIDDPKYMTYENRYAIGGLIAPTIVKAYKEKGPDALKKYLEEAKNENLAGALKAIGIEKNAQGFSSLLKNYQQQLQKLNIKER